MSTRAAKADTSAQPSRRGRVPSLLQLEATECGAVCLAMVLAGFGRWVPLDEVRNACGVSRDGVKALNILRAGRGYGLTSNAWRYSSVQSLRTLPMPAIVFVNLNHFVVLDGFDRDRVHLNDPALGRRRVTVAEFQDMFSNIALTFEPGPGFVTGGRPSSAVTLMLDWLKGSTDAVVLTAAIGILLLVPGLVIPSFLRVFTDYYLLEGQIDWIYWLLVIMATGVGLQAVMVWLQRYFQARLLTQLSQRASARFVHRMLRLPILFFLQRYPGSISNRVGQAEMLSQHAAVELVGVLVSAVAVVLFGALMASYHPLLAGLVVTCSACALLTFLASQRHLEESGQRVALLDNKVDAITMQGISLMEALKAAGTENTFFSRWSGQMTLLVNEQQRVGRVAARLAVIPEFVAAAATVTVLAVGGLLVMRGELTIGLLVAFQSLQGSFMAHVNGALLTTLSLKQARGVLDQIHDVLDSRAAAEFTREAPEPTAIATPLGRVHRLTGRVSVQGLSFGYARTEPPLMKNFNLDLAPGTWVALVGGSGSGKSTVGRLVNGLCEPWSGTIAFDGNQLAEIPRATLRDSLAVVDQEIVLFQGTIRENLTLWDESVPESVMVRAARDAEIHDDIMVRPGGYDALVSERGRNFSGGQCQRLEIARALITDPTILVLDEATSALDPEVEARIITNLRRRGCTCLVIAHRLSTIRDCDEIIVMGQGKVLERGTHDDLVERHGFYRRLIQT